MVWLCLHFRLLSLDVLTRGDRSPKPRVIVFGPETRLQVLVPNAAALVRGIHPGMRLSAAQTLVDDLELLIRDSAAEQDALSRIAAWSGQFTSTVSLSSADAVLLEIGASLRLFGGLAALRQTIERGIAALGYHAQIGIAPTPLGATWLARAAIPDPALNHEQFHTLLRRVPLQSLALDPDVMTLLHGVGLQTVGDCLHLPRDALARRCGSAFVDRLDRACGHAPDPLPLFVPPAFFTSRLPLPVPVADTGMLLFAIHRLVLELSGFLQARVAGVMNVEVRLHHRDRPATVIEIGLVRASRDAVHLMGLLRMQIERIALPDAVHDVELVAPALQPLPGGAATWLDADTSSGNEHWTTLIERLRARLGDDAVAGLKLAGDHRPEYAWRDGAPGEPAATHDGPMRPLWLLAEPLPLGQYHGRPVLPGQAGTLILHRGPERIESGWWDGDDVQRDYFVALHDDGMRLWVFRERCVDAAGERKWFLHGLFG